MSHAHEQMCRELHGMRAGTAPLPADQGGLVGRWLLKDHRGVGLVRFADRESARRFGIWLFVNHERPNFITDAPGQRQ